VPGRARSAEMTTTTVTKRSRSARARRHSTRNALVGWSFILPNFLGFATLTLVPVIASFALAFMKWNSYTTPEWVGLKNFRRMLADETFWISTGNTFVYAIGHVPLTFAVSLGLALLLNKKMRGVSIFRTAAFFPYITSMVATAVVWNMLFSADMGPINQFLHFIGIANPPGWTGSTTWAMPAVIITSVWHDMGYYMVLFLAGLQSIPPEYYEAAAVDGANTWQKFRNITMPSLGPTTFFVLIMLTISSFKVFDLIFVMTGGGPGRATMVLSQLIYQKGIAEGNFGYSSAISLAMFLIVLVVTALQFGVQERKNIQ
jgi:ABC-type sugar transport system permease subunit